MRFAPFWQCTQYQYTVSVHSINTQCKYTVSVHSISTQYQYTVSIHSTSTQYQYTVSVHSTSTQYQYTVSVNSIRTNPWTHEPMNPWTHELVRNQLPESPPKPSCFAIKKQWIIDFFLKIWIKPFWSILFMASHGYTLCVSPFMASHGYTLCVSPFMVSHVYTLCWAHGMYVCMYVCLNPEEQQNWMNIFSDDDDDA